MTFGLSGTAIAGLAVGAAGLYSASQQAGAAEDASNAQSASSAAAIAQRQQQGFGAMVSFELVGGVENVKALADAVSKAKPAGSKGTYIQRVAVSSTMGPGVKVEPGTILG